MPGESPPTQQPSIRFASDVKPLFRERARTAMRRAFHMWSRDESVAHGEAILGRREAATMSYDAALWLADRVALFERWLAQGGDE
jgi:hypothetical protein